MGLMFSNWLCTVWFTDIIKDIAFQLKVSSPKRCCLWAQLMQMVKPNLTVMISDDLVAQGCMQVICAWKLPSLFRAVEVDNLTLHRQEVECRWIECCCRVGN